MRKYLLDYRAALAALALLGVLGLFGAAAAQSQESADLPAGLVSGYASLSLFAFGLRGAMLFGAASAVGGWAFLVAILLPALEAQGLAAAGAVIARWRRWTSFLLLLSMGASTFMLLAHTLEVADRPDLSVLPAVAFGSQFGVLLVARIVLAAVMLVLLAPWGESTPASGWRGLVELLPVGGLLLLTFSLAGHAAVQAEPALPVAADWLHLSAAALWPGGLAALALLLPLQLAALPEDERAPLLGRLFTRFAALATLSAALLTATGIYAARRQILSPADLWQSAYGLALLAKAVIFCGLIAFGAYHLLLSRARLTRWAARLAESALAAPWWRRVASSVRAEAALGFAVILAAGALTSLPPPAEVRESSAFVSSITYRALNESIVADDLRLQVGVDPTLVGTSTMWVTVTDSEGRASPGVELVQFAIEHPQLGVVAAELDGIRQPDDSFSISGPPLNIAGDWQMRLRVLRSGADAVEATITLPAVIQQPPIFFCNFTAF